MVCHSVLPPSLEDSWQCLETFCAVTKGAYAPAIYCVEARLVTPQQRIIRPKMSIRLRWRDPDLTSSM